VEHVRPARWETRHLQGKSPENISIQVNELLDCLHAQQRDVKDVQITSREVRYGKGPIVTHYDAWVIFAHRKTAPVREPAFALSSSE
jgi:hypothetical protein